MSRHAPLEIAFFGSSLVSAYWNGAATYYRGVIRALHARGHRVTFYEPDALVLDTSAARGLEAVGAWLFGKSDLPVRFFGDLDFAGMQILGSLREVFAQAEAWRPGYAKLATVLSAGDGHTPEAAGKGRQGDPGITGCAYADGVLLPLMRQSGRFVDQEGFGASEA